MCKMVEKTCHICHGMGEIYVAAYDRYFDCWQCDGTGIELVYEEESQEKEAETTK